jgi:hypothetical protein
MQAILDYNIVLEAMQTPTRNRDASLSQQYWNWLSGQQEHECPADCKGKGCHIEQEMLECPPLSEWRHGV